VHAFIIDYACLHAAAAAADVVNENR